MLHSVSRSRFSLHGRPIHLYLIFEKSSLTNWIFSLFRTGFLLCLCSLQKSISKLIFAAVKNQVQMDRAWGIFSLRRGKGRPHVWFGNVWDLFLHRTLPSVPLTRLYLYKGLYQSYRYQVQKAVRWTSDSIYVPMLN